MEIDPVQEPITETSLSVYFKKRLSDYARRLKPPPQDDTCWYIGSLLERFGRSDRLFGYAEGRLDLRPLALLYGDALEARSEYERCLLLQQLGDMALFLGALFPEHFTRRGIQQDYVVGMGGNAYEYLADNARRNRHIFAELANTFIRMLEMVANACSRQPCWDEEDVMTLYRHWLATGDPVAAGRLQSLGIAIAASDARH